MLLGSRSNALYLNSKACTACWWAMPPLQPASCRMAAGYGRPSRWCLPWCRVVTRVLLLCFLQDEVDSLGQSRDSNSDAGARRLLTELLIQFNKVAEQDGVYIFAATNRMQVSSVLEAAVQQSRSITFLQARCYGLCCYIPLFAGAGYINRWGQHRQRSVPVVCSVDRLDAHCPRCCAAIAVLTLPACRTATLRCCAASAAA